MTDKVMTLLQLSAQLTEKKQQKNQLHNKLIETNRLVKKKLAPETDSAAIKQQIVQLTADIRSLEHDLSILTITLVNTASIVETPYGRVVKYTEG